MIAMNGQGATRGKVCVLEIEASCNQSLAAIHSGTHALSSFLFHLIDSKYEELRRITGDGRNGLNLTLLRTFRIPLPPMEEQRVIAEMLDSVDEAIASERKRRDALAATKASAAHALLTGQVRVGEGG